MTTDKAILGAQPFLRGMADGHLAKLAALCEHVAVPARQRLFEEGATADRFWLVDAGRVTIDTIVPGQGRLTIEVLGRGDLIGLAWLTPPYQWRFGAVATQRMQAYQFDARAVRAACDEDPSLGFELSRRVSGLLVRRLAAIHNRLIETSAHAGTAV
jgi:CRP/FNR family transcriptional regulator, cyclic AMP receptor protein